MKREDGSVVVFIAILLPILIGIIGLTIDGGMLLYRQAALKDATEAAAKSALLMSYDIELWANERRILVDEERAAISAEKVLKNNSSTSRIDSIDVKNDVSIVLETSDEVHFTFVKIFGIDSKTINDVQSYSLVE